ncbi:TPA: hypothetical protein ACH3X2_008538 [Trebouxia sp. C0005]
MALPAMHAKGTTDPISVCSSDDETSRPGLSRPFRTANAPAQGGDDSAWPLAVRSGILNNSTSSSTPAVVPGTSQSA